MTETLRQLLIQRAARLQTAPAFHAETWGTLSYLQFRNRVEGLALALLAHTSDLQTPVFFSHETPWGWVGEVAAACCGLRWAPQATCDPLEAWTELRFNDEAGRPLYHDREASVTPETPFWETWTQGAWLTHLQRLNRRLGWDHETVLLLPPEALGTPEGRRAAWSVLYAGGCLVLGTSKPHEAWLQGYDRIVVPWSPDPFLRQTLP